MREHESQKPRWPRWAQIAWWLVIAFAIFSFVATLVGLVLMPDYAARHLSEFTPNDFWTYQQTQAGLAQLGWPSAAMVWVQIGRSLIGLLATGILGLLLLRRKSHDWFGLYVAFAFLLQGLGGSEITRPLTERFSGYAWFYGAFGAISWQLFFIIFYFFPNGQPVPRWIRWIALAWGGYIIVDLISPGFADNYLWWLSFPFVFSALGSQIYRFFWRTDAVQRQQTKWVMASVVVILLMIGLILPGAFEPPTGPNYGAPLIRATINLLLLNVTLLLFPVAIGISILFYRLYDIDVIIRKTLVYSVLTALLGLVYFGSVVLLQRLFGTLTGVAQSPLAVVISTLAIAALFTPLRRRIQDGIDRRFYRRKYNAQQVLVQFAVTARDETDLDALTGELARVVQETLQPEHVSVWLRQK